MKDLANALLLTIIITCVILLFVGCTAPKSKPSVEMPKFRVYRAADGMFWESKAKGLGLDLKAADGQLCANELDIEKLLESLVECQDR